MADNLTIDFADAPPAAAPAPASQGLQIDFVDQPKQRVASGIGEAIQAGYQGSLAGLADRGKLPDIVLDAQHSKWYEKLAASASTMVNELPEMAGGMFAGGAAGAAAGTVVPGVGNVLGGVIGAGVGAFAVPTAIRESLMQAYSKGEVQSAADFLGRSAIVMKATGKDALVGALTAGAGLGVGKLVAPALGEAVMAGKIGATTARVGTDVATTAAELGTLTTASAALEGHLPQPEDFWNGGILLGGMKGAGVVAGKLRSIYAETGIKPEQVVADAQKDPTIAQELSAPPVVKVEGEPAPMAQPHEIAGTKIVDADGEPLKVFHGTADDIKSFDPAFLGSTTKADSAKGGFFFSSDARVASAYASVFADRPTRMAQRELDAAIASGDQARIEQAQAAYDAANQAGQRTRIAEGANVHPVYLDVRNPLVIDFAGKDYAEGAMTKAIADAKEAGHDGVVFRNVMDDPDFRHTSDVYVAFDAKQIRSVFARDAKAELAAATAALPPGISIKETPTGFEAVNAAGERVGYLNDNLQRGQAAQIDENANVSSVAVDQSVKGQGVGRALYAAFFEKHDGRVLPSGQTTADAWAVWKRNYPEKVDTFVESEAQRIRDGADPNLVLGNITDPQVKTRVAEAAEGVTGATDIPTAYQAEATATRAADIVPGVKTEAVVKQPFGPVTQAAGEPAAPTEINYNYMHTTDDAKAALARLSAVYEAEIQTQRRGTVSWEQTQAEAGQHIADLLGSTTPFEPRAPGTAAGAAELLARKQMLQGAAEDMATKAREYLATPEAERTPQQTAEYLASIERAAMIQSEFLGARAEAGRALNILKETKLAADRAEQIQDLINRYGKDPADLARMMADIDNPTAALKFAKDAAKASTWDKLVEAWKAGLVSGPVTQLANVMGNLSFAAMRPVVDGVAATFGVFSRAPDRVGFVEPFARVLGNIQGAFDGMRMARVAFLEDTPAGKVDAFKAAIPGTLGYVVRTPFRVLSAADELFRSMAERGEAYAIATRQASTEGYNPATSEFRQRVVEIANDLSPDQAQAVQDTGARLVFQAKLGDKAKAVQNFVREWHLEWAVPFIATPANIFKEMTRMSPAAPIIGEWRAAVAKGGPEAHKAIAEMVIGTGISVMTMSWALSGNISGSGDPDPNKRRAQMAAGWQPYSIKVGDTWYSYQRVQPLGTLMGMASDIASVWDHMTPEESDKIPKILATAFANAVTNQTFLQGITSVVQVMADPTRYGPKFINGMAGSVVPAVVGQSAQLLDPYQREVNSMLEAIKNRIPGVREGLTPTRDIFGEPQANPDRLGGVSPITERTLSQDPVRKEAARLGVGTPEAPKAIELPAGGDTKLGKVTLTPEQRDIFGDVAGHLAHDVMTPMVNSPGWNYMPDFAKQKAFKLVFEKTREAGKAAALTDAQRQQEIQRITGEISKRLSQ